MKKILFIFIFVIFIFNLKIYVFATESQPHFDTYDGQEYSTDHISIRDNKGRYTQGVFDFCKKGQNYDDMNDITGKYTIRGKYPILLVDKILDSNSGRYKYYYSMCCDPFGEYDYDLEFTPWGDWAQYYENRTEDGQYVSFTKLGFATVFPEDVTNCSIPTFFSDDPDLENKIIDYRTNGVYTPDPDIPYNSPPKEHDDSIELPQNLHLASGYDYNFLARNNLLVLDKDLVLTWNQTVDTSDYTYEVDVSFKVDHVKHTSLLGKEELESFTSDYFNVKNVQYGGQQEITCTLTGVSDSVENDLTDLLKKILYDNGWQYSKQYVRDVYIRVRNVVGNKTSNYVTVSLSIPDKNASANVTDDEGNIIANDNYNNTDVINNNDINGENVGSLSDFSSIITFVKSGFGLIGKNGFVDLLSNFFGKIFPSSFWNIIVLGMGVVILVGIINFILKR